MVAETEDADGHRSRYVQRPHRDAHNEHRRREEELAKQRAAERRYLDPMGVNDEPSIDQHQRHVREEPKLRREPRALQQIEQPVEQPPARRESVPRPHPDRREVVSSGTNTDRGEVVTASRRTVVPAIPLDRIHDRDRTDVRLAFHYPEEVARGGEPQPEPYPYDVRPVAPREKNQHSTPPRRMPLAEESRLNPLPPTENHHVIRADSDDEPRLRTVDPRAPKPAIIVTGTNTRDDGESNQRRVTPTKTKKSSATNSPTHQDRRSGSPPPKPPFIVHTAQPQPRRKAPAADTGKPKAPPIVVPMAPELKWRPVRRVSQDVSEGNDEKAMSGTVTSTATSDPTSPTTAATT